MALDGRAAHRIETFLARRLDQDGITQATANRYLALLKTLFKTARQWGYVVHNPAAELRMAREEQKVPPYLTDAEVEALLGELPPPIRPIVVFALETGLRRGELFRLQWKDVDRERGWITVRQSKNKSFRVVPLSIRAARALSEVDLGRRGLYVFAKKDGSPRMDVRRPLQMAARRAGIGHVHLHLFRHTFATRLRDLGVAPDRIKELLGHKRIDMALRYAKCTPTQLKEAIRALDQR